VQAGRLGDLGRLGGPSEQGWSCAREGPVQLDAQCNLCATYGAEQEALEEVTY